MKFRATELTLIFSTAMAITAMAPAANGADGIIRIGEMNSYKVLPGNLGPYKLGWELAQEQINQAGGVNGKKFETIFRDDNANAGDAVRVANELLSLEKVDLLAGTTLSHVGLAISDFAKQKKVLFIASGPLTDRVVWQSGNRYTYRVRSGTHVLAAAVVSEAARMKKKRWALVYPNYEYGQMAIKTFKESLKKVQPDVEFVTEQAPPLGKVDAGALVQALIDAKPDAIFNVLFGTDLIKFAREGKNRGLFDGREVVSLLTGEPEYMDPLKEDTPKNWLVTGYPYATINTPEHKAFITAYQKKYNDYPRLNSVVGYATMMAIAAGVKKAGSTDTEKMVAAFKGLQYDSPFGKATFRPQDNQSTLGLYVGRTAVKDGKGYMATSTYIDGASVQPTDAEIKQLRPEN